MSDASEDPPVGDEDANASATASAADSEGSPLLSVEKLRAGYGETEVLQGVSLDVHEGEVVTLVGRNGVGKTTTLETITGAIPARGGAIDFRGKNLVGLSPVETAQLGIGLVPEERRIFPGLTVRENLQMAELGGADVEHRWTIDQAFDTFENLQERQHNRGADLSGGEQQMLSIARAMVAGADLLMLDEPTEGLAPIIVERVEAVVRQINEQGITVLLVEQNVAVALDLADRAFILDRGQIVYAGDPQDLADSQEILDRHLGVSV